MPKEIENIDYSGKMNSAKARIGSGAGLTLFGSPFAFKGGDVVVNALMRAKSISDVPHEVLYTPSAFGVISLMVGFSLASIGVERLIVGHADLVEANRIRTEQYISSRSESSDK